MTLRIVAGAPDLDVTVVIPTKDRPLLVRRAVRAALRQADVRVEVVVVDDGSAIPIVGADFGDDRVKVCRHDRSRGVALARNAGLDLARAPHVAFCDDDDVWAPMKLRRQLDAMIASGARWSTTGAAYVDADGTVLWPHWPPLGGDVLDLLLGGNRVPGGGSTVLAERALVAESGGFDPAFSGMADWDLWIRLAERSPVATVAELLTAYTVSCGGMAHDVARMDADLRRLIARHAARRLERGVELDLWLWHRYVGDQHHRCGRTVASVRAHARSAWDGRHAGEWGAGLVRIARSLAVRLLPRSASRLRRWRRSRLSRADWSVPIAQWLPAAWAIDHPAEMEPSVAPVPRRPPFFVFV